MNPRPMHNLAGAVLLTLACLAPGNAEAHGSSKDHDHGPAMNYHPIDDRLVTGGHFFDGGLDRLAGAGVTVIVELREDPPEGQAERVAAAGMEWIHVPVDWNDPEPGDFDAFKAAMADHPDAKVLVQCQANYRASAFAYLYRIEVEGVSERTAREDLEKIWQPEGRWGRYIESILD